MILAVLLVIALRSCRQPQVSFSATKSGENIEFKIHLTNANGLAWIQIFDRQAQRLFWSVSLNYYPGPDLVYGQVPQSFLTLSGNLNSARQQYPESDQRPLKLPIGKELVAQLHYHYVVPFHKAVGGKQFSFLIEPSGLIRSWETQE
jgi:hypothetical protein